MNTVNTSLALIVLLGIACPGLTQQTSHETMKITRERTMSEQLPTGTNPDIYEQMERVFAQNPGRFSEEIITAFRERRIVIGMDPYLATVVGGAFAFKVKADPKKWSEGSDPMKVILSQANHPDESEIVLTFENDVQFPKIGHTKFEVIVTHGKVSQIFPADGHITVH